MRKLQCRVCGFKAHDLAEHVRQAHNLDPVDYESQYNHKIKDDIIDNSLFEHVWSDILEDHKSIAREQEFLLPSLQWRTLLAVAKEEFVKAPQSREVSVKYDLSAPSSMARSIKALLDKGLIIECGDKGLRVYNVFIQKNLQKHLPL